MKYCRILTHACKCDTEPSLYAVQVSTMNEIEWVQAQSSGPDAPFPLLKHYTMGFYIHSCPKVGLCALCIDL